MASLATFSPAATRPCASAAPSTRGSNNLVVPRAGRAANPRAASPSVVSLFRSPKQLCSSSSVPSSFGRRSIIVVARAATAATSSLPPLAPLDDSYSQTHTFSDVAHWIVPGALMVGRYPYVEPSRCTSREVGEEQMKDILERGGARKFVCLQAELPPQERMPVGGVKGFLPYRPTATLIAAALSGPPSLEVMEGLRNPHLDAFLPPRRKADRHAKDASHLGAEAERHRVELSFAHRPLNDMRVPETTKEIRDIVDEEIAPFLIKKSGEGAAGEGDTKMSDDDGNGGGVVYIHCWGGRGRAGMVAAATLARLYGVSAEEALERVDRALKTREPQGRAPQTDEQVEFVRQFVREL